MPLPTTSRRILAANLISEARAIKSQCQAAIAALGAGAQSANAVLSLCQRLNAAKVNLLTPALGNAALLAALADDLGLADAAAAAAAIGDLAAAITAAIDWVVANFPSQTAGGKAYILKDTLNADGSVSVRSFAPAQTAGLRTLLAAIVQEVA